MFHLFADVSISVSDILIGEILGTMLLVYLGNGVVANVVLKNTKGNNSGLIVIAFGWAMAVMIPALMFGRLSGAHFNPALTIGLATIGAVEWGYVLIYIVAQFTGALLGSFLVYIHYKNHFDVTEDKGAKLAVFATGPAIRDFKINFISELLATFVLVFTILGVGGAFVGDASNLEPFAVGGIILVLGVALGGTTGYALNPARDLGPRIAHAILPIKNKGSSDWKYALIPVIGPIIGAVLGALLGYTIFL